MIVSVASGIYDWEAPVDEMMHRFEETGELADVDAYESAYIQHGGLFLVAMDGKQIIGSGALRLLDEERCEVKRLWLIPAYQRKGIGYNIVQNLFAFARRQGCQRVVLYTDVRSERALAFYRRLGFEPIEPYCEAKDAIFLGMAL